MADQIDKRRNLATKLVNGATGLMDAINELGILADEYISTGVTFLDSDFINTDLKHVTAANIVDVITSATATKTWLQQNFHDDNFLKVRR